MTDDLAFISAAELAALIAARAVSLATDHDFFAPIGLQLVGPHLGDARLLRAAALFESARPWGGDRPPLPAG
jgi:Asp-tRNA(Asn)/Glu-tRNA(Gln) amidotransferase A subunit family amidase